MDRYGLNGKVHGFFASRANIALIACLVIAGFFLVTEHRAHLVRRVPYLPWLFLLAYPLLHVFMHGGRSEADGPDDRQMAHLQPSTGALSCTTMFRPMGCGRW